MVQTRSKRKLNFDDDQSAGDVRATSSEERPTKVTKLSGEDEINSSEKVEQVLFDVPEEEFEEEADLLLEAESQLLDVEEKKKSSKKLFSNSKLNTGSIKAELKPYISSKFLKHSIDVSKNLLVNFDSDINAPLTTIALLTRNTIKFVQRTRPRWHQNGNKLNDEEQDRLVNINLEGYDIGHLNGCADFRGNLDLFQNTFSILIATPQLPSLNRFGFLLIESTIRAIVNCYGQGIVVSGAIYDRNWNGDEVDLCYEGELDMPIPTFFWKSCLVKDSTGKFRRYTWLFQHRRYSIKEASATLCFQSDLTKLGVQDPFNNCKYTEVKPTNFEMKDEVEDIKKRMLERFNKSYRELLIPLGTACSNCKVLRAEGDVNWASKLSVYGELVDFKIRCDICYSYAASTFRRHGAVEERPQNFIHPYHGDDAACEICQETRETIGGIFSQTDKLRCSRCNSYRNFYLAQGIEKERPLNARNGASSIVEDGFECENEYCDFVKIYGDGVKCHECFDGLIRCKNCALYLKRNGVERFSRELRAGPHARLTDDLFCFNPNCHAKLNPNSGDPKGALNKCSDGERRCKPCAGFYGDFDPGRKKADKVRTERVLPQKINDLHKKQYIYPGDPNY